MALESRKNKPIGTCRLTGKQGLFVEAHILPKALTRPVARGVPFTQGGRGQRPVRRWSSWTDKRLVTADGENILRDVDTWAISQLRAHQLVWSGWGGATALPAEEIRIPETPWGFRQIDFTDTRRLRVFGLSLLWRAAASKTYEMSEIILPSADLEELTRMVRDGDPTSFSFYPFCLCQLSTRGETHNHAPIQDIMVMPPLGLPTDGHQHSMYRIYMDGLLLRFYRYGLGASVDEALLETCVGGRNELFVSSVTYESSFQAQNLNAIRSHAETHFGDIVDRLSWPPATDEDIIPKLR